MNQLKYGSKSIQRSLILRLRLQNHVKFYYYYYFFYDSVISWLTFEIRPSSLLNLKSSPEDLSKL